MFLGFPFNIASYATLAKILEEITLFVALGVEGNLKCVHFYDNQKLETLLKEILMWRLHTGGFSRIQRPVSIV
jgi:thymidylate synthase